MDADDVRNAVATEVKAAVAESQGELLDNLQSMLTSRLDDFQQGLQKSQMDISNSQMAKIEENLCDNFTFRRKGNENQYKHEAKVLAKLKEANTHLNDPNVGMPSVNAAKEKISEGIELVQNRQKVIKLADSSVLGWKVVQEYISNPIADGSDDEKKMYRAQMRAEKKQRDERYAQRRFGPYPKWDTPKDHQESSDQRRPGRCYDCGQKGHWAKDCRAKDKDAKKLSSNFDTFSNCLTCKAVKLSETIEKKSQI